jgi:hypothetical protein
MYIHSVQNKLICRSGCVLQLALYPVVSVLYRTRWTHHDADQELTCTSIHRQHQRQCVRIAVKQQAVQLSD